MFGRCGWMGTGRAVPRAPKNLGVPPRAFKGRGAVTSAAPPRGATSHMQPAAARQPHSPDPSGAPQHIHQRMQAR
ncbi:hypothetical protein GCM10017771_13700 [Streptomyces capitiformicae]|uniref:Uncharacterized protein n=1 Tax=Streptomyces capitiformicae TaxID=2014920 RepID=A0A919GHC5_9ACTN|nr:hypothetical protein GCM10017771_13700 [Streptomyces capitiformicae]